MRLLRRVPSILTILKITAVVAWVSAWSVIASAPPARADVNDFSFASLDVEYELGRDADGHSILTTTERFVAEFPEYDQNRGFIRDIPREYAGFDTHIDVRSVTDENGQPRPFTTEPYGDYLSVTMAVPEGSYVHGQQTYVLTYTQRDVTNHFDADAGGGPEGTDEFYWDVNGTEWSQPFGRISVRLTLSDDLVDAFSGAASCYRGTYGSSTECELTTEAASILADESEFGPYENLTIAAGFAPGTFTLPQPPFLERVPLIMIGGFVSLAASIGLTVFWGIRNRRGFKTGRAIIAQYEPPAHTPVAFSAEMVGGQAKTMTATLLDFAVRRNLRLLYDAPSDTYGVQALTPQGLEPDELTLYTKIAHTAVPTMNADGTPGMSAGTLWFDRSSTTLGDAAAALKKSAKSRVTKLGLRRKPKALTVVIPPVLLLVSLLLLILHSIVVGNTVLMTVVIAVGANVLIWAALGMIAVLASGRPRTEAGALLHDHLMGLREYIRLAEADRLRVLQSASGAEVSEDRIVQIYERLLPYAVLFGYEKEWQAELSKYYRESTPDWVSGSSVSNLNALSLSSMHLAVASSPVTRTVSTSSGGGSSFSSFGGSSGGGFSGGGGGGGGGRGI